MAAESQEQLRSRVRALMEEHVRPFELDIAHGRKSTRDFLPLLVDEGIQGRTVPTEYGGEGAPFLDMMTMLEEISRVSYPVAGLLQIGANLPVEFIGKLGSADICNKYLPGVVKGHQFAEAMSEPDAGSALSDMTTRLDPDGDGFVLNGRKCWVSYAESADYLIVFARFGESVGSKGIGAVIIPTDVPGYRIDELWPTMASPYKGVEALMTFDNVRVPKEDVLVMGDPANSDGFTKLMSAYNTQRLGNAANCLGLMQGAFDLAVDHAKTRQQFGRPIGDFQGLRWKLADMAMKLEAVRSLAYRAAAEIEDNGLPSPYYTSLAKTLANETVFEVTSQALQVFGGYGYRTDYPLEYRLRIARGQSIAGGSVEMQRNLISTFVMGSSVSQRAK
jgi:alkylation response protein AidB-like acyl-CoA dehydrogenase